MRRKLSGLALGIAFTYLACVSSGKGLSGDDKDKLKELTLDALPQGVTPLSVDFENNVHILGVRIDPEIAKPGTDVRVTLYWRADEALKEGWQLFTHVLDESEDRPIGNLDGTGPLRQLRDEQAVFTLDRWERGKVMVDEVTYRVPDDVKGANIKFLAGVWRRDGNGARLRVVAGANDDNRAIVAKLKTGVAAPGPGEAKPVPASDVPGLVVNKLVGEKIVIDGKGNDKAWETATSTGAFVDVGTGKPNTSFPVNGTAKVTFDDTNLYAFLEVKSAEFYQGFTDAKAQPKDFTAGGQPKLWTKDTVELMIDPDGEGDNRDYFEIQINPQNKLFKSHFETRQMPSGGDNGPFGHEDWDAQIKSAVSVRKDGDNKGYDVELAIPWTAFAKGRQGVAPKGGESWRFNFYAMKENGGVSWSPILGKGNFHFAPRFGRIVFGKAEPVPSPSASPSASAAPATSASGKKPGKKPLLKEEPLPRVRPAPPSRLEPPPGH